MLGTTVRAVSSRPEKAIAVRYAATRPELASLGAVSSGGRRGAIRLNDSSDLTLTTFNAWKTSNAGAGNLNVPNMNGPGPKGRDEGPTQE